MEPTATEMMKVVVALDESDGSFYALKWVLDHLPDSAVTLVHVTKPYQPLVYGAGPGVYASRSVIEAVKKTQEENAAALLSRALHLCKEHNVRAETLILEGEAKEMICKAAEELQVDLVVVGRRGIGAIKRAFLGSVSDYCAHHVTCPLLIVNTPPKLPHQS